MKEPYEAAKIEIVKFEAEDIVTASGEYELPEVDA